MLLVICQNKTLLEIRNIAPVYAAGVLKTVRTGKQKAGAITCLLRRDYKQAAVFQRLSLSLGAPALA
jgi:hypothetical protein